MLLKVVILILIVYLSYSIYKFIILFDRYNNIQKISDNEICGGTITSYYEDKLTKDKIRSNSNFLSGEEIYFEEIYYEISGNYAQQYNLNQRYITYINKENNFKFYLTYDTEKQKYIYDEEDADEVLQDIEFPYSTRKQLYIASLLDMFSEVSFIQMLKASLNPSIIVTDEYIKHLYIDGYSVVEFNNKGDIYEGISKSYIFTDKEEGTNVYEVDQRFDYNIGYYNEEGTLIEYDLKNIESIEDFARSYGIEVEIEK